VTATFRFYEELNDFLPPSRRRRDFTVACARAATTKHMVEALGVPHTEVELILLNGESVGFDRQLAEATGSRSIRRSRAFDVAPLLRLRERPLRTTRFVADAHLGGLAPPAAQCSASTRSTTTPMPTRRSSASSPRSIASR
jgi:hypothetical protein